MTPLERYQQDIDAGSIEPDPSQRQAMQQLQRVYLDLLDYQQQKGSWKTWFSKPDLPQGLYLWGGVGIGKTYMMDTLFHCIISERKCRYHFHEFLRKLHQRLTALKGTADPLDKIAKEIADGADILCFDEFFVVEIADAMLLGRFLQALSSHGVILVATSNVAPEKLYEKGLQRELFLPVIELIKQTMVIFHCHALKDYRLDKLTTMGVYFYPLDSNTEMKMRQTFSRLVLAVDEPGKILHINDRAIPTLHCGQKVVWFDFNDLCSVPRSQQDYLVIAQEFHTVLLSNVPKIMPQQDNLITYLIYLVDIFYDAKVKLIIAADVAMDELYTEGRRVYEFARTLSRLQEMQSEDYLAASTV